VEYIRSWTIQSIQLSAEKIDLKETGLENAWVLVCLSGEENLRDSTQSPHHKGRGEGG